jgi:O-acetyl-ADP-ribose deacetylase (regulator of RNase III)
MGRDVLNDAGFFTGNEECRTVHRNAGLFTGVLDMATVAVGDIHGHRDALDDVLAEIRDEIDERDRVVFLGDYIDRGHHSSILRRFAAVWPAPAIEGRTIGIDTIAHGVLTAITKAMATRPLRFKRHGTRGVGETESARRRGVLRETIAAFERADPPDRYHHLAQRNLDRWRANRRVPDSTLRVDVVPGDWGEVTGSLTSTHGECFAVLNMANPFVPGGGYLDGAMAQEENMFRRTDCHFSIGDDQCDSRLGRYVPAMTRLLSGRDGVVYLDTSRPRVCIRGPEERSRADLGYRWLQDDEVFPFFELRAAAQDLRDGSAFDPDDARRRVSAQLDTLRAHGIRHAVLGASGCGAFLNPARHVAQIYSDEVAARAADFAVIAFAIYPAGYGPDNFRPFAETFSR